MTVRVKLYMIYFDNCIYTPKVSWQKKYISVIINEKKYKLLWCKLTTYLLLLH